MFANPNMCLSYSQHLRYIFFKGAHINFHLLAIFIQNYKKKTFPIFLRFPISLCECMCSSSPCCPCQLESWKVHSDWRNWRCTGRQTLKKTVFRLVFPDTPLAIWIRARSGLFVELWLELIFISMLGFRHLLFYICCYFKAWVLADLENLTDYQ